MSSELEPHNAMARCRMRSCQWGGRLSSSAVAVRSAPIRELVSI